LRSKSVQRAAHAGGETHVAVDLSGQAKTDYEECLACQ
jgi:ribonucleoside-diphosphate reductase alpha chain